MPVRVFFVALFLASNLVLQAAVPERKVESNVIISERDPAVRIKLPKAVQYVGADRFILYDVADCELHAFVEAKTTRKVNRLYWVQFEGYLATEPELHYSYDSPRHVTIGGLDFYLDTWVQSSEAKSRPGSDGEHINRLIAAKGYTRPEGMMSVRLVHLLDNKRKELIIIYSEDLAPTGLKAADLDEGGKSRAQWPAIEKELIERAIEKASITTPGHL